MHDIHYTTTTKLIHSYLKKNPLRPNMEKNRWQNQKKKKQWKRIYGKKTKKKLAALIVEL